jgi:hypothetical protein
LSGTLGNLFTQRCGEFLQIENAQEFLYSLGADPRLESLVVGSAEPIFPFENDTSPFEGRIPLLHHDVTGILQCDGLNLGAEASGMFLVKELIFARRRDVSLSEGKVHHPRDDKSLLVAHENSFHGELPFLGREFVHLTGGENVPFSEESPRMRGGGSKGGLDLEDFVPYSAL